MIGKYVIYENSGSRLCGEILDFQFSPQDNTWLFFLALHHSELGTQLVVIPFKKIISIK